MGSTERHLYTHRGGKWAVFYDQEARTAQLRFFERHLKGRRDVAALPRVRLEVRDRADHVVEVREEQSWPLERTEWMPRYLSDRGLAAAPPTAPGSFTFGIRRSGVRFGWTLTRDTELTGPMALRLYVELLDTDDMDLVVGVEKWSGGRFVPFEGSYGYGRDRVATGWQNLALRALDTDRSRPFEPVPACLVREPVTAGDIVPVDIALGASSTLFRAGDQLRLVVAGRWLSARNPFTGQFPASYRTRTQGRCTLHWGPDQPAHLLLPHIPAAEA
ncbi:CocE/NonD family hydrolase [Streptomyces sp. SP18ES09]|uniref:CocE/NonD family hydrolase n=1 Tax=Streptomyces sp. SP18ES09 TaxID=3002532 RepID=UPI002E780881|nr:CocE/NonD family hydrolase [Streptomyces sp. SP18ES09]MEE1820073.1 CocE/NonD family hydrolase [Streptomyces sp. SP18ES09]